MSQNSVLSRFILAFIAGFLAVVIFHQGMLALLFGAIAPTLVAWFLVAPLKNQPIAGGFQPAAMLTGLLVNGAWGIGTALLLRLLSKRGISGGGSKRSL